ncbi:MAG: hypothetical protein H6953_18435 [Chromatiaceae bacterium]|jgi:hypothetical protein|nr:hypothetical protein [Candidatus Competibacteraceae bacterium]MCP5307395.1 hypothetical protein [Chromatiaceae bacterium]
MSQVVGISQKIKRAWLDVVLDRLAKTTDAAELRVFLDQHLKDELPGPESRAKNSGIILRIWSGIPANRIALRNRAVALLPRISGQERIWLHWGMTALAYPFFRDTAEVVGRLLALQDDFTTAQVQGRMLTTWGDRATSKEAAQKLITTLVDWEVLRSTKTKGHFLLARKMTASIPDLQLWLLEALLGASAADEIEAQQLLRLPELFPFGLSVGVADLRGHKSFTIHRQGLDMDMVALQPVKLEPTPKPTPTAKKIQVVKTHSPSLFDQEISDDIGSNNERSEAHPEIPATAQATDDRQGGVDEPPPLEESINRKVLKTRPESQECFCSEQGAVLAPDNPFEAPSAECTKQFQAGHYFGCIALTQALIEAEIRHIGQIKLKKKPNQKESFEKDLDALHKKNLISDGCKTMLDTMWAERHSFHYLRPLAEYDQRKLEETAKNTLKLLNELEHEFFGFSV